ncbi:hypothetical protein H072_1020 [Dactylellina haptotyla CBS 200.50]|uniref:Nephrocystin 3-like N-terminal domain-containing protein n=1 Tax=Dactylellina haptotyla (strain CBS 200.50) TaxID=1284197 RepID=S8AQ02_DACHA|nr:hypothetical protein H072_1020 [Dactylellina haptotyla CBS 200.50]
MEQKIIAAIPNLLYLILDFSWHTNHHLDKNKLLRSFKECFSNTLQGKIENITVEYTKLRSLAQDTFQETVMQQLSSLTNLNSNLKALSASLFPAIEDLSIKLVSIGDKITEHFQNGDLRTRFVALCRHFQYPSEVQSRIFVSIFEAIRREYRDMLLWLFDHPDYRDWVDHVNKDALLLCMKGPRGFGKSVKMTVVIKRLMAEQTDAIVLFFYFKKGDDATERTRKALESLVSQVLEQRLFHEDFDIMEQAIEIIEQNFETNGANRPGGDTPEGLTRILSALISVLKRPVYIIIDGVDECEDRVRAGLVSCLKQLCRSETGSVKVMCSVRDNVNIETLLVDHPTQEFKDKIPNINTQTLPADIRSILLDESYNSKEIRMFLSRRVEPLVIRRLGRDYGGFDEELQRIVSIIELKANGNFIYASMAVANLLQPTRDTLEKKLSELPPAMEGMYKRSMEVLTPDERELVTFVLKWVIWGHGSASILEIIQHYKRVYDTKVVSSLGIPQGPKANQRPPTFYGPSSDPEIDDTKYHLYNAGRDFFQFDNAADSISVHLSVREWIENEAKQAKDLETKHLTPPFVKNEQGQWTLSVVVPDNITNSGQSLGDLRNKREANLSITTSILSFLNNKEFQARYRPWNPPNDLEELYYRKWNILWNKNFEEGATSSQKERDPKVLEEESVPSEYHNSRPEAGGSRGDEANNLMPAQDLESESEVTAQTASSGSFEAPEFSVDNSDNRDGTSSVYNLFRKKRRFTEETSVRNSLRYEARSWIYHFNCLQQDWEPEERKGKLWDDFWEQFTLFIQPQTWRLWISINPSQVSMSENYLDCYTYFMTPLEYAALEGWVFILDYLVQNGIANQIDLDGVWVEEGFEGFNKFPLFTCCPDNPNFTKALLKYGASPNPCDPGLDYPYFFYLTQDFGAPVGREPDLYQQEQTIKSIIAIVGAGLDLSTRRANSRVARHYIQMASGIRNIELFKTIYSKVPEEEINASDKIELTALHHLFSAMYDLALPEDGLTDE